MKKMMYFGCFASSARFGAVVVIAAFLAGCKSDSAGKNVGERVLEAKFLTRLDKNRQLVEIDSPDWDEARYYAVKPTTHFVIKPEVRFGDDFNSSTYQIADGQTIILAGAYETEPYTGRVIINVSEP